jgi:hypothetical protein
MNDVVDKIINDLLGVQPMGNWIVPKNYNEVNTGWVTTGNSGSNDFWRTENPSNYSTQEFCIVLSVSYQYLGYLCDAIIDKYRNCEDYNTYQKLEALSRWMNR